jgi:inward rectifier potassium channel
MSEPVALPDLERLRDLGFGTVVANQSRQRLLNRDGSFNVVRHGLGFRAALSLYHSLLTLSWPRFLGLLAALYLLLNALFALGYVLWGPGALIVPEDVGTGFAFLDAFFFSVQTLSTVGYGQIAPATVAANALVTMEAMAGLFCFALVTGLVFARFSRPTADILFSHRAVIAPYEGITAFMFRIANRRKNQIIDLEARVVFSRLEHDGQRLNRRFYTLTLEREKVDFFPMSWTIVHPIDTDSPLRGLTAEQCLRSDAEFLILLTGIDETFSQTVHARSSYKPHEIAWNSKFENIFHHGAGDQPVSVDLHRLHAVERLGTG